MVAIIVHHGYPARLSLYLETPRDAAELLQPFLDTFDRNLQFPRHRPGSRRIENVVLARDIQLEKTHVLASVPQMKMRLKIAAFLIHRLIFGKAGGGVVICCRKDEVHRILGSFKQSFLALVTEVSAQNPIT